jgi:hypothetical protein
METSRNRPVARPTEAAIRNLRAAVPYIGYPRALSALSCVNEVAPEEPR